MLKVQGPNSSLLLRNKRLDKAKSQIWHESVTVVLLRLEDALCVMEEESYPPLIQLFVTIILKCKENGSVTDVMHLLMLITKCGLETHETLGNFIVPLLSDCGKLCDAQKVFNKLCVRNDYSWNSLIVGLVNYGEPSHALTLFSRMHEDGIKPNGFTFVALLKACAALQDVQRGQDLHHEIARLGLQNNLFVGSSLIDMYMNCDMPAKAMEVFEKLREKDVVSWNALIAGFCKLNLFHETLEWYQRMQSEDIAPSNATFILVLKAVNGLEAIDRGLELHSEMISRGLPETDSEHSNLLVHMYANCGFLAEAEKICKLTVPPDSVSWTALLAGYCKHMLFQEALGCFKQMQVEGIAPNSVALVNILKACAASSAADIAKEIHGDVVKKGLLNNSLVNTALIDTYGNHGMVAEAQNVFACLPMHDLVSWTALIAGYLRNGHIKEAADCFFEMEEQKVRPDIISWNTLIEGFVHYGYSKEALGCIDQMQAQGIHPDTVTFLFCLKACGSIAGESKGRELHIDIIKKGFLETVPAIGNALVDFYATSGLLVEAQSVLYKLPVQDAVSWTSLLAGYTRHRLGHEALSLLNQMQLANVLPSTVTFVCSLKTCALMQVIRKGQELHLEIEKKGLTALDNVGNALLDMYVTCGLLEDAQDVFDMLPVKGIIAWTTLITGYAKHGDSNDAMSLFEDMRSGGLVPDAVSWSTLISGYAIHNCLKEALTCLKEMKKAGICPDAVTFVSCLKACGSIRALNEGQKFHAEIECAGLSKNFIVVSNALVDMYATCGFLLEAQYVLEKLPYRDTVSWTSLIAGYTKHGYSEEALYCLKQMQVEGLSPDAATFIWSLKACGIAGSSERGQEIHEVIASSGLLGNNALVANALLTMYIDCGLLANACKAFNKLILHGDSLWTAMIAGFAKHGHSEEALECFRRMRAAGAPSNALSGNASLGRHASLAECENAFDAYKQTSLEGTDLNVQITTSILTACSHSGLVHLGLSFFSNITKHTSIFPVIEHHVCMVDLLGRAGQLQNAVAFINLMPYNPTIVVWHTILGACGVWGHLKLARQAFEQAVQLDAKDTGTYISLLNICASVSTTGCHGEQQIENF